MHRAELEGKYLHTQLSCKLGMSAACCGQLLKGSHKAVLSTALLPGGSWMCPWRVQGAQQQALSSAPGRAGGVGSHQPSGML